MATGLLRMQDRCPPYVSESRSTDVPNHLNVYQYLYTLLLYMPDYKEEPAGIEQLLPWSEFMKEHCTGLTDVESNTIEHRIALPFSPYG